MNLINKNLLRNNHSNGEYDEYNNAYVSKCFSLISFYPNDEFLQLFLLSQTCHNNNDNKDILFNSSSNTILTDTITQSNTVLSIEHEDSNEYNEEDFNLKNIPFLSPHFILSIEQYDAHSH